MKRTVLERGLRVRILTGFSLIILLTVFIAAWSYYHISTLGSAAENLFLANYRSIQYAHLMAGALGTEQQSSREVSVKFQKVAGADSVFRAALAAEYQNITEPGELEITRKVDRLYHTLLVTGSLRNGPPTAQGLTSSEQATDSIRGAIAEMLSINEKAMFNRAEAVKGKAEFARLSTLGITSLLISAAIVLAIAVSRRSLAEFRELDRAKSNFVATAAHELKNPISSIKTTSGLLLDEVVGPMPKLQRESIEIIRQESERLLGLVRELLELAQFETGTLVLNLQNVGVAGAIENAILPLRLQAQTAEVGIDIAVADGLRKVRIDEPKLGRAITNLVANAIRYSPQKSHIIIRARKIEQEIWISVTDEGRGIGESDLARIFEKFVQVEEGALGSGSGTGLGLSIAKEIVQAHHGRIWATSSLGRGSTFTIALPMAPKKDVKRNARENA